MSGETKSEKSLVYGSETVARTLMGATGQACKVTGLSLSATSTLYFANALTSAGVETLNYLPQMATSTATMSYMAHMASRAKLSRKSVFWLGVALLCGIAVRKLGTVVSDDATIKSVENFLYAENEK